MNRPKTNEYESMTFPKYVSQYNHTTLQNVPQYALHSQQKTLDDIVVYKQIKPLIPQTHLLTALDGEEFYYQQLLWQIPFQDDRAILTTDNVTRTFKE